MRTSFIYFLFLIFSSCAGKELVVRNADTLLEYQVKKRIPLNDKQKQNLARDIDTFLNQEKVLAQEMLPIIDEINLDHPDKIDDPYRKLESFYRRISYDFSTLLAKHLSELDPSQQEELFKNLEDENKRMEKRTQRERRESAINTLEKFIGELSSQQVQIVKSYDSFHKRYNQERLKRRRALHQEFKQILTGQASHQDKATALVKAYLKNQDSNFSDSKVLEITKKIIPTLSLKQKEKFREKTREVKEILQYFVQANY